MNHRWYETFSERSSVLSTEGTVHCSDDKCATWHNMAVQRNSHFPASAFFCLINVEGKTKNRADYLGCDGTVHASHACTRYRVRQHAKRWPISMTLCHSRWAPKIGTNSQLNILDFQAACQQVPPLQPCGIDGPSPSAAEPMCVSGQSGVWVGAMCVINTEWIILWPHGHDSSGRSLM